MILCHDHGSLDTLNLKQLVGRLGTDNGRARKSFRRTYPDRKCLPVDLRRGDSCCPCLIILHIIPEQLAYAGYIRSVPTQKCCSLKGTHTCLIGEVVGIDHDTGIHGICLCCLDLNTVCDILQHLRYHLTGGRRIRLYIGKHCIADHLAALTVMIHHDNGLHQLQKLWRIGDTGPVYIHNYQHGTGIHQLCRLGAGQKQILRIIRIVQEAIHHRLD